MRIMRSWMYVPGHRGNMIEKAFGLKLDVAIFDLEDGVPSAEKDAARDTVSSSLGRPPGGPVRFVRTHAAGSSDMNADLPVVVRAGLEGLVVPKVERPEDVLLVDADLEEREAKAGMQPGSVRLVALIESARGLVHAPAIAASCPRLVGLMFGAEDFALDLGIHAVREGEAGDMLYARSALVVAAASERLQAIDKVYLNIRDPEGLLRETRQARQLGFTGKTLIHPNQIETVHEVFRPTAEEVEYARRVVDASERAEAVGEGSITVDGQMVDMPVVERARRVLESHQIMDGGKTDAGRCS